MFSCGGLAIWALLLGLFTVLVVVFGRKKSSSKLCGIYSQPGTLYWFKVVVFYCILELKKWRNNRNNTNKGNYRTEAYSYDGGIGTKAKDSSEEMDRIQPLSDHFQAIDAIYFNGADNKGFQITTGTARRPHGVVNGFIIFRIPEIGVLVSPKFPDTLLFGGSNEYYGAEGIKYELVTPMKHWKLSYEGNLKLHGDYTKTFHVILRANWTTKLAHFDFDCMLPSWTLARALAKETWNREYFEMLKTAHQTHYEQHGDLAGEIVVDGKSYVFNMPSFRDHSFGYKRNWKLLHRYMMHMFHLEDGRRFTCGVISQPVTSSLLECGYMYEKDGSMYALAEVGPPLYAYGENGTPPIDYAINLRATNGNEFLVQIQVLETQELYIGWEWEARIVERRCKFSIDGVEGFGISECHYRNMHGRPNKYTEINPEWVTKIKTVE